MDTINVGGDTYIKASQVAKNMGYTSDYVGQLCRGGKITATLVGRTWYVREGELEEHKQKKQRLNQAHTIRELERAREEDASNTRWEHDVAKQYQSNVSPGYRSHLLEADIVYSKDDNDSLVPPVEYRHIANEENNFVTTEEENSEEDDKLVNEPIEREDNSEAVVLSIRKDNNVSFRTEYEENNEYEEESFQPQEPIQKKKAEQTSIVSREANKVAQGTQSPFARATVALGALLFIMLLWSANVVLEGTWQYSDSNTTGVHMNTTYGVASVREIVGLLKNNI